MTRCWNKKKPKSCPKSNHSRFDLKLPKSHLKYLGYFWKKIVSKTFKKYASLVTLALPSPTRRSKLKQTTFCKLHKNHQLLQPRGVSTLRRRLTKSFPAIFKKWANPGLFLIHFRLFKQMLQFLQQIYVKKCPTNIQCRDSNPWTSGDEFPPITTRPGLPSNFRLFFKKTWKSCVLSTWEDTVRIPCEYF